MALLKSQQRTKFYLCVLNFQFAQKEEFRDGRQCLFQALEKVAHSFPKNLVHIERLYFNMKTVKAA